MHGANISHLNDSVTNDKNDKPTDSPTPYVATYQNGDSWSQLRSQTANFEGKQLTNKRAVGKHVKVQMRLIK